MSSSSRSRGPRSTTQKPSPFVALPDSSSSSFARNASTAAASIAFRSAIFSSTGLTSALFAPGVHVNYESRVLPIKGGLPKLKDFPAELGGSGEVVAE